MLLKEDDSQTPLRIAARAGHHDFVEQLLNRGVSLGETPDLRKEMLFLARKQPKVWTKLMEMVPEIEAMTEEYDAYFSSKPMQVGHRVQVRDTGLAWRDGTVVSLDNGRPRVKPDGWDDRPEGYFWEEVKFIVPPMEVGDAVLARDKGMGWRE